MKYLSIISFLFLCNCCSIKDNTEQIINDLVSYRKQELAMIVYKDDVEKMYNKYGITNQKKLLDVSQSKLVYEKCLLVSFRENKDGFDYKDDLGNQILKKWKSIDYMEKYHFENYNHRPTLSLMKMFDFYNSKDLKKYSDSLVKETSRRYNSGKFPDLEDCVNHPEKYIDNN